MENVNIISEGDNYTAIDIGEFDNLMDYSFLHPQFEHEVKGKVFIGEILKSSGTEISFQNLPPKAEIPFLHKHKNHEEVYIFLKGKGQFQVDGNIVNVKEGTAIRVSPDGKRTLRNNSDNAMIFMVIQSQEGSIDNHYIADGYRINGEISWEK